MWFCRQRYNLPNGDFDRIRRQQAVLLGIARKAVTAGTISNPVKLNRFLQAASKSVSVDESVTVARLRALALSVRGMRSSDIAFLTVPNDGPAWRSGQSVVLLDRAQDGKLYKAVRDDTMTAYVRRHGDLNDLDSVS
jgi:anionic cell wall polymer biosynthesis LytR-Cps2A-Psr (LCP) family protein